MRKKMSSSPAQVLASHLLAAFAGAGIDQIFLAPGARSQALAIAAGQLADADKADLFIRLDERSMGFSALGVGLATGKPALVITTSGTAVANLHPAVLEAHHSGVPMILLTADRPHELREVGANQTTKQVGIFDDAVRVVFDVEAPTEENDGVEGVAQLVSTAIRVSLGLGGVRPGPVQLNLAFREPLSADSPNAAELAVEVPAGEEAETELEFAILDGSVPTVVIAGAGSNAGAVELAEAYGLPVFAEPSSGARFGDNSILSYSLLLTENPELRDRIGRVIVFGKPTLSRSVIRLFFNQNVEVVVVRNRAMGLFDVSRRASMFVDDVTFDVDVDGEWLEAWRVADQKLRLSTPVSETLSRREIVEQVWNAIEPGDNLVLGASRMIREAEVWAPAKNLNVFANRGLAGIDGTVATATGIALATREQTRVLLGDLTLLHDANSLVIDPLDGPIDLQLVVVNDRGGSIFETLEPAKTLSEQSFNRLFRTPQEVNLATLAVAYGWLHVPVYTEVELEAALRKSGRVLIEVKLG
jgi:2-succinyl-5-enolpyruvyl-6-hydroxy-3-cyclohexene-1-carboxylate synthase